MVRADILLRGRDACHSILLLLKSKTGLGPWPTVRPPPGPSANAASTGWPHCYDSAPKSAAQQLKGSRFVEDIRARCHGFGRPTRMRPRIDISGDRRTLRIKPRGTTPDAPWLVPRAVQSQATPVGLGSAIEHQRSSVNEELQTTLISSECSVAHRSTPVQPTDTLRPLIALRKNGCVQVHRRALQKETVGCPPISPPRPVRLRDKPTTVL